MSKLLEEKWIERIADEVARQLRQYGRIRLPEQLQYPGAEVDGEEVEDLVSKEAREKSQLRAPWDPELLRRMKKCTTARIAVGHTGSRLLTRTFLTLRADHAKARDSVFTDVDQALLECLGLFSVQSCCESKDVFVTRPDLGRKLNAEGEARLRQDCLPCPDVQIYAADGLSSTAVEKNLEKILPILLEGLKTMGIRTGTPFFMRYGRVGAEDQVAEILGAKVVCVLIGERPGLATAESMSAYIAYNAHVGMPEANRTVVSNIHRNGLSAAEAGAYIVEVIGQILRQKASGINLVK